MRTHHICLYKCG